MARLFQELTPPERDEFVAMMAIRNADGSLSKTGHEIAVELISQFVTQSGKLQPREDEILGGQPSYGRAKVVIDLIRAVCGPSPTAQAWLDAIREGTFGLGAPLYYRGRTKPDPKRAVGSPGNFLPRMIAQYKDDAHRGRPSQPANVALYAEAAMITAAMMLKAIRDACGAAAALGVAWVVNLAVDKVDPSIKRQIDALADNPAYLAALRAAIIATTSTFADQVEAERTSEEVKHSLPPSADVEAFFDGREQRHVTKASDALVEALERRVEGGEHVPSSLDKSVEKIIAAVRAMPATKDEIDKVVSQATAYLHPTPDMSDDEVTEHHRRLRYLMPDLANQRTNWERGGRLATNANAYPLAPEFGLPRYYADQERDLIQRLINERIIAYALVIGPPPPSTPLGHLPAFEAAASTLGLVSLVDWPAEAAWRAAGLCHWQARQAIEPTDIVNDLQVNGLGGLDLTKAWQLFGD